VIAPGPGHAPAAEIRILALGDSYTIGEAVAETDRWPVRLASMLRARGLHVAAPTIIARTGWTTDELANQVEGYLERWTARGRCPADDPPPGIDGDTRGNAVTDHVPSSTNSSGDETR